MEQPLFRGQVLPPSTPPANGPVEYASDPESARVSGRRGRRLGLPGRMRVGKRGRGTTKSPAPATSRRAYINDAAADSSDAGARAPAAAAVAHDGRGAGGARRPSAGRRFGAMLRRGAPSLNNLRRSGSKANVLSASPMDQNGDLAIPALGMSPPIELEDPPLRHSSHDGNMKRVGDAEASASASEMSASASGRRRFYRSKSAIAISSRDLSGGDARFERDVVGYANGATLDDDTSRAGPTPADDALEHSDGSGSTWNGGGGGASATAKFSAVSSMLARKGSWKTVTQNVDGDGDDQVAFWSGSDVESSGGTKGRQPRAELSEVNGAALGHRRDRSAPPSGRASSGVGGCPPSSGNPVGAAHSRNGTAAATGDDRRHIQSVGDAAGRGTGVGASRAASLSAEKRKVSDNDAPKDPARELHRQGPTVSGSASAASTADATGEATVVAAEARHAMDSGSAVRAGAKYSGWNDDRAECRISDGYTSAPDATNRDGGRSGNGAVDECIAKAEAALFAVDAVSDPEIDAGGGSSQGNASMASSDWDEEESFSSRAPGNATAATGAEVAAAPSSVAGAAGGKHATGGKRRRLSELLGFRRRSAGAVCSPPLSTSFSDTGPNGATAVRAANGGKQPPRRVLNRSNSTSALDRISSTDEDFPSESSGAASGKAAGVGRQEGGARRRLLPGGSSSLAIQPVANRGASASPEKHRRSRDSFLEAGKHKLRRGRSRLSRGSFVGRPSSQQPRRTPSLAEGAQEGSSEVEAGKGSGQRVGSAAKHAREKEPLDPKKQGSPAKPQLGTTYAKRLDSTPLDSDSASSWNNWTAGRASQFSVRTKGYGRTKVKAPSAPELYEVVSIDAYRSPAGRICGIYPMFSPPVDLAAATTPPTTQSATAATPATKANGGRSRARSAAKPVPVSAASNGAAGKEGVVANGAAGKNSRAAAGDERFGLRDEDAQLGGSPSGGGCGGSGGDTGHPDIPPVFVVNCQLPDVPTPFSVQGDGPTLHVVFTFRATRRLCSYAARVWAEERNAAAAGGEGEFATAAAQTTPVVPLSQTLPGLPTRDTGSSASARPSSDTTSGVAASGSYSPPGESDRVIPLSKHRSRDGGGGKREGETEDVPESVRLLVEWMRRSEHDGGFRGRFKAIGDIVNADEVGLPSIARRFSGKPILLYGKESSLMKGPGFVELDLNAHAFSYVGRKGLYVTLDKWKRAVFRIGFLLEGRTEEEQPEHMLGCTVFHGLDIETLSELSLSADGKRLIVTNSATQELETGPINHHVHGGAPSSSAVPLASRPSFPNGQTATSRVVGSDTLSSSSKVPLIPRRHMALLLRRYRDYTAARDGRGEESPAVVDPDEETQAFFNDKGFPTDGQEDGGDGDVTITAVAASAFAGGWFCALLAVITMACWSELAVAAAGPSSGQAWWRESLSAWLVAVFVDP